MVAGVGSSMTGSKVSEPFRTALQKGPCGMPPQLQCSTKWRVWIWVWGALVAVGVAISLRLSVQTIFGQWKIFA
jgi:hypothetical protein